MTVKVNSLTHYQVNVTAGRHAFVSDEPLGIGDDAGPSPMDLLLSAVGSCVVITLHMYANRKGWPLESAEVELDFVPDPDNPKQRMIEKRLTFHGELDEAQKERLLEIAERCPVNKMVEAGIKITSRRAEG